MKKKIFYFKSLTTKILVFISFFSILGLIFASKISSQPVLSDDSSKFTNSSGPTSILNSIDQKTDNFNSQKFKYDSLDLSNSDSTSLDAFSSSSFSRQNFLEYVSQNQITVSFEQGLDLERNPLDYKVDYLPSLYSATKPIENQNSTTLKTQDLTVDNLIGFSDSSLSFNSQNVPTITTFSVTFDQPITPEIASKLTFYPDIEFTYQLDTTQMIITPKRLLRDTEYIFGLKKEVICLMVCGDKIASWLYALKFKTDYKDMWIYGKSIENRDLVAFAYGKITDTSGKVILLSSGIHGEEWRSGGLENFLTYLNNNPQEIVQKNKVFLVIPVINPDGKARNLLTGDPWSSVGRYNARNVNLNRNWPAYWENCANCGNSPASEPETYFLKDFVLQQKVTHWISYHSQWPPNGIIFLGVDNYDPANQFARWVSDRSGYPVGLYDGPESGSGVVPGDQSVWGESVGIRSLIIEATYRPNSDYLESDLTVRLGKPNNFVLYLELLRNF